MRVREANYNDLEAIHHLVVELAIYEKAADQVTATLSDYQKDFSMGAFQAIVAENEQQQVIGMMIFYSTFSTWRGRMLYLEDFVVNEAYRRSGTGQLLFDYLLSYADQKAYKLVKWQVLDWNEPAIRFYEKNKAIFEKEWYNVKIFTDKTLKVS